MNCIHKILEVRIDDNNIEGADNFSFRGLNIIKYLNWKKHPIDCTDIEISGTICILTRLRHVMHLYAFTWKWM